jgi:hypothetical protein
VIRDSLKIDYQKSRERELKRLVVILTHPVCTPGESSSPSAQPANSLDAATAAWPGVLDISALPDLGAPAGCRRHLAIFTKLDSVSAGVLRRYLPPAALRGSGT